MDKYHKIHTVFKRDPKTKYRTLLMGEYALPEFEYLAYNQWVFTEKIDGTNIRVGWDCTEQVRFGGRTDRAQIPVFLLDKLQDLFPPAKFGALYPETPMTLYGEGYGAKIQKGGGNYIPDGQDFILFDVMVGGNYLERHNVEDIAEKLGIEVVPIHYVGSLLQAITMAERGFPSAVGTQTAEGLVMRPQTELRTRRGGRVIAKIKYKDFPR